MAKTLADMTPEERKACVGMWCEWDGGLRIIGQIFAPHVTFCGLVRPNDWGLPSTADLELVTPRFDLLRAWNPDGTPVKGEWEKTRIPDDPYDSFSTQKVRRFVGEYEDEE